MGFKGKGFYGCFSGFEDYQAFQNKSVSLPVLASSPVPVFKVSLFPSGELSAAYYLANSPKKYVPSPRAVSVSTEKLSHKSVQKIRRCTENSTSPWKAFITLTFDSENSELNESGKVCHKYAKAQLIRFRQALSKKVSRQISCKFKELPESEHEEYRRKNAFRYIWVCELQQNGNIHFHLMVNKYFAIKYLSGLWGQGSNAVDVKKISDAFHAASYICKYITKDDTGRNKADSIIQGNRYNISKALREDAKPMQLHKQDDEAIQSKKLMALMKELLENRGGRVIDSGFGMNIPRPSRSVPYRDKKTGTIKKTRSVDGRIGKAFVDELFGACPF